MLLHRVSASCVLAFAVIAAWSFLTVGHFAVAHAQSAAKRPPLSEEFLEFLTPIDPADGDDDLQKKLKERHNAAVELLAERVAEYTSGTGDVSGIFEAARLVAESKLDLAETADARVAALEQTLYVAQAFENLLKQQLEKGFGSKSDLARARFARLSVEVELLKAKGQ